MDFIKKYTSHEEYEVDKTPNVSLCVENNETKHLHYTKKKFDDEYLTFEALESGTFTLTIGSGVTTGDVSSVSYSLDGGETWTTTNNVQGQKVTITTPTVNAGDEVLWKGSANRMSSFQLSNISTFSSTANFNARGNVMSLLYGDDFNGKISLNGKGWCFNSLFFNNTKLVNGKNISLPATTLANDCYYSMFKGCTSLTTAPELPATRLVHNCYLHMFYGCTSLTTAPELPATTLADRCYDSMFHGCTSLVNVSPIGTTATTMATSACTSMFQGCTSLTVAPELPATTLADYCYQWMFEGCTSLTVAPELPATTLASGCYQYMFQGCTSLTTPPELPATTLASSCYQYMFSSCENLTVAPALPATTLASSCYEYMFSSCIRLTSAPVLPATTLASGCYASMFNGCTSLTTAPVLSATTLASGCYQYMFYHCTGLATAPELPATTMTASACTHMFNGCTSLTVAPELPATTMEDWCYNNMFNGCTSLTTAPELPATTLADWCYNNMFRGCTNLTTAPVLPATTLEQYCYGYMFYNCANLTSITCLATDISASNCTENWVYGVAASGTFVKPANMSSWTSGVNGIPTNWTVRDYSIISTSLVMYVDDFPEERLDGDYGETVEEVMQFQLGTSNECLIGNKYVYTGETITYNGNTYYLWEMSDDCSWESNVVYLLTTTDNFSTLYAQSLEDDLTNHFTSLVGRLDEDKEDMYNDGEIGDEYELYLVKVVNNSALLRIWVDDFPEDMDYDEGSAQDNMMAEVEDPDGEGANPYEYLGETIVYNGNTYYLWQAVEGYDIDNPMTRYFATTTIDFNTLYSQSLEDGLTNHFTDAIGMFDDSKDRYWAQAIDEDDELYLVKVEDLS